MNIPLLRRIQRQIDKAPEKFHMAKWNTTTECYTTMCIGGWAEALSNVSFDKDREESLHHYGGLLDLTDDSARRLFWTDNWPFEFGNAYEKANSEEERAGITNRRIDHFITTEGRE